MAQDAAASPTQRPPDTPLMRHLKQAGLCLAGAGFLAASVAVSRRSVVRMKALSYPAFYSSNRNTRRADKADGGVVAVQALGLATLNVMSFGIMLVGGISWAFDLSSVAELRERTQNHIRNSQAPLTEDEKQLEAEMEKIVDGIYSKLGLTRPPGEPQESQDEPSGKDNSGQ